MSHRYWQTHTHFYTHTHRHTERGPATSSELGQLVSGVRNLTAVGMWISGGVSKQLLLGVLVVTLLISDLVEARRRGGRRRGGRGRNRFGNVPVVGKFHNEASKSYYTNPNVSSQKSTEILVIFMVRFCLYM